MTEHVDIIDCDEHTALPRLDKRLINGEKVSGYVQRCTHQKLRRKGIITKQGGRKYICIGVCIQTERVRFSKDKIEFVQQRNVL